MVQTPIKKSELTDVPQARFVRTGVFEDGELLQSLVYDIVQNLIYAQYYPLDDDEKLLLNKMMMLIQRPDTTREDWTALKDETLDIIGSKIGSFVCHATSAFRTPAVGAAALRSAGEDLIKYADETVGNKAVAQDFLRSLLKQARLTGQSESITDQAYLDWRRSEGIWE